MTKKVINHVTLTEEREKLQIESRRTNKHGYDSYDEIQEEW